jgi:hypothetical protein
MALPDVISADLSLDALTCPTVVREVPMAVTSLPASAFPELCQRVGNQQRSASNDFMQVPISRAAVIPYVQASRLACHPGRPHRCGLLATQVVPTVADLVRKAAVALSSEQNVIRYLLTHRTC